MDEEIRRLHVSDEVWSLASESWRMLEPNLNFNQISADDETEEEFFRRIEPSFEIPFEVVEQWIYPHYLNSDSVKNYGWIDYSRVVFRRVKVDYSFLEGLSVIDRYSDYVKSRARSEPYKGFMCIAEDREHWKKHHTWKTPPVVVDVLSFPEIPSHAEMKGRYQLVEGHTRLGYFLALHGRGMLQESVHEVFLMSSRGDM